MIALTALVISVIFGAGIFLMLRGDLFKAAAGTVLVTNSAILFLIAAGLGAVEEAILPVDAPEKVFDPVVQALAITAIVIGFGITALLLKVALSVQRAHGTVSLEELRGAELRGREEAL